MKLATWINCWHINQNESASMWHLYSKSNDAIAIQTRYDKLRDLLPDHVLLNKVKYISYEHDWIPEGITYYRFLHKRKSFEHEQEIRGIFHHVEGSSFESWTNPVSSGINVPINLVKLVEHVYVAPTADEWFEELVRIVTAKFDFSWPVERSSLRNDSIY